MFLFKVQQDMLKCLCSFSLHHIPVYISYRKFSMYMYIYKHICIHFYLYAFTYFISLEIFSWFKIKKVMYYILHIHWMKFFYCTWISLPSSWKHTNILQSLLSLNNIWKAHALIFRLQGVFNIFALLSTSTLEQHWDISSWTTQQAFLHRTRQMQWLCCL